MKGDEAISIVSHIDPGGELLIVTALLLCLIKDGFKTLDAVVEGAFVQQRLAILADYLGDIQILVPLEERKQSDIIIFLNECQTRGVSLTISLAGFPALNHSLKMLISVFIASFQCFPIDHYIDCFHGHCSLSRI